MDSQVRGGRPNALTLLDGVEKLSVVLRQRPVRRRRRHPQPQQVPAAVQLWVVLELGACTVGI